MKLKPGFVRTVKKPGRYGDGRGGWGLALLVRPRANGGVRKSWIQRIRINGRPTNLGLGVYPVVGLKEARKRAIKNLRLVEQGIDPRGGGIPTFREAAEKVIQIHSPGWKKGSTSEQTWRRTLNTYAYPLLGTKRVDRITTNDIMNVLVPIWHQKPTTAKLVKQKISTIMRWAIAAGHRHSKPQPGMRSAPLYRKTPDGSSTTGRCPTTRSLPLSAKSAGQVPTRQECWHWSSRCLPPYGPPKQGSPDGRKSTSKSRMDDPQGKEPKRTANIMCRCRHRPSQCSPQPADIHLTASWCSLAKKVGRLAAPPSRNSYSVPRSAASRTGSEAASETGLRNAPTRADPSPKPLWPTPTAIRSKPHIYAPTFLTCARKLMKAWANYLDQTPTPQEGLPSPE